MILNDGDHDVESGDGSYSQIYEDEGTKGQYQNS